MPSTPDDQKALAQTVKACPTTEHYELDKALTSLGTGEAIVTVLGERGAPTPVAWTRLRASRSLMGTIRVDAIREAANSSDLHGKYAETIDRESAYEKLDAKVAPPPEQAPGPREAPHQEEPRVKDEPGTMEKVLTSSPVKSFLRSAATVIGREITRGLFGTAKRRR